MPALTFGNEFHSEQAHFPSSTRQFGLVSDLHLVVFSFLHTSSFLRFMTWWLQPPVPSNHTHLRFGTVRMARKGAEGRYM